MSAISIVILLAICFTLGRIAVDALLKAAGIIHSDESSGFMLAHGGGMALVVLLISSGAIWLLRKESFAYTHYPIRFNRKTKTVYVFRTDGTVMSVPWDEVFFTLASSSGEWEVRGHVLADDKATVLETFALSGSGVLSAHDTDPNTLTFSDNDFVRAHWEFIRRYMEDGPQAVSRLVQFCMPVDGRRETVKGGAQREFANFAGGSALLYLFMFPISAVVILFRVFAMRTSKIPQWPKEVEAACAIEPGDPYAIEGDAAGDRVAVFPDAARAAGVAFVPDPSPSK